MLRLKLQKRDNDCAVLCVQNALELLGKPAGRGRIIRAAFGDEPIDMSEGLDAPDIRRALSALGFAWDECCTSEPARARAWLRGAVGRGPVIMAMRNWSHWELLTGSSGRRIAVHDPETGPYWASYRWLYRRWPANARTPRRLGMPDAGRYYAILVSG